MACKCFNAYISKCTEHGWIIDVLVQVLWGSPGSEGWTGQTVPVRIRRKHRRSPAAVLQGNVWRIFHQSVCTDEFKKKENWIIQRVHMWLLIARHIRTPGSRSLRWWSFSSSARLLSSTGNQSRFSTNCPVSLWCCSSFLQPVIGGLTTAGRVAVAGDARELVTANCKELPLVTLCFFVCVTSYWYVYVKG